MPSPLHVKQAQYNGLVKLSQALQEKQDLVEAIKVAYPHKTEHERWKLARDLTHQLHIKLTKAPTPLSLLHTSRLKETVSCP